MREPRLRVRVRSGLRAASGLVSSLFLGCLLSACPETQTGSAPKTCTRAYDKCEQQNGVLGVCDVVECTEGQAPPCLTCRSQH
jgi:hypothetical protein